MWPCQNLTWDFQSPEMWEKKILLSHQVCSHVWWLPQESNACPECGLRCFHLEIHTRTALSTSGTEYFDHEKPGNSGCLECRVQGKLLGLKGAWWMVDGDQSGRRLGPSKGTVIGNTCANMSTMKILIGVQAKDSYKQEINTVQDVLTRNMRASVRLQLR